MDGLYAEKQVLGSMMLDRNFALDACEKLSAEHFESKKNAIVFSAIKDMEITENFNCVDVVLAMKSAETLDKVGSDYVYDLPADIVSTASAESYMKYLRTRYLVKTDKRLINEGIKALDNGDLKKAEAIISNTEFEIPDEGKEDIKEIANRFKEYLDSPLEVGTNTNFIDLDKVIGGMHGGDLIIVAARPAMGKSAFAVNIMENIALDEGTVVMFSFEMSNDQLFARLNSIKSQISMEKILKKDLSPNEKLSIIGNAEELEKTKLFMYDNSEFATVGSISKETHKLAEKNDISLIIIDYLQLMSVPGMSGENRNAEISKITRGLKLLAKDLNVPILLLSQLSRASEKRTDKRPILSDLRDSGAVEQDADIVMFLHRPSYYNEEDNPNICEVNVAKHRQGPTGTVELVWKGECTAFKNKATTNY